MKENCKLTISVNSQHTQNKLITTSATIIIPLDEYIPASEIKENLQQIIVDVLHYRIENKEWPKLQSLENEEDNSDQ